MPRRGENIYKRKDGRWEGRYPVGFRPDGKRRYRSVYGSSYQAVREKLIRLKSAPRPSVMPHNKTVGALLSEWIRAIQSTVKESTFANYEMKIRKHLLPAFGGLRCDLLSVREISGFIEQKQREGLSAKYIADMVVLLKSAFKYAARVFGMPNPLQYAVLPKSDRTEKPLLTATQQKTLLSYLLHNPDSTAAGILCSLCLGLRIGEVCGLKASDLDLENRTLTVRRTVQRISSANGKCRTKLIETAPKSRSALRMIPIPQFLADMLQHCCGDPAHYVISGCGQVTEPRTMQYRFRAVLKKAGLPSVNYHSLRHIFATNCLQAGFDVKTLSEILGHASPETTLNRYVHTSMARKVACMQMLAEKSDLPSGMPSAHGGNAA